MHIERKKSSDLKLYMRTEMSELHFVTFFNLLASGDGMLLHIFVFNECVALATDQGVVSAGMRSQGSLRRKVLLLHVVGQLQVTLQVRYFLE